MTFDANVSSHYGYAKPSFFSGFEPKSLLVGTMIFYMVSGLLALGYLALDHPSLGLGIFVQNEQTATQRNPSKFIPVYSTLTADPSQTIKNIESVLANYDLNGIKTVVQCQSHHCSVTMQLRDPQKQKHVKEVIAAFN